MESDALIGDWQDGMQAQIFIRAGWRADESRGVEKVLSALAIKESRLRKK